MDSLLTILLRQSQNCQKICLRGQAAALPIGNGAKPVANS